MTKWEITDHTDESAMTAPPKFTPPYLTPCGNQYGAPMGRYDNAHPGDIPETPFIIHRVPIDEGGYDPGGAYWGIGNPMWWAGTTDGEISLFIRARTIKAAQSVIREMYDSAMFLPLDPKFIDPEHLEFYEFPEGNEDEEWF